MQDARGKPAGIPWMSDDDRPAELRIGGTIRSRVAHHLRDRIIVGDLPPGSRIDLDEVANALGTSRTPVREACLELAHDGLVKMAPRSGIVVIGIKPQDLLDNFSIMTTLAGMAATWAAIRMTPEKLEEITRLRDEVAEAITQDGDIALANWRFHRAINLASESQRLITLLAQTGRLIPANFFKLFPAQIPCTMEDHIGLVDSLANRDHAQAGERMIRHFNNARQMLVEHFRTTDLPVQLSAPVPSEQAH